MCHEPRVSTGADGSSSTIKSISDGLIETKRKMDRILAELTGREEREIAEATSYDHYFTAEEAVDFGLCDKIITIDEMLEIA
jgi:ATP-dependent Clp protease protease subunit